MQPKIFSIHVLKISSLLLYNSLYESSFLILNTSKIFPKVKYKTPLPPMELNNPEENSLVKLLFINLIFPWNCNSFNFIFNISSIGILYNSISIL